MFRHPGRGGAARVRGTARVGRRTKDLVRRLRAGDIAVIDHGELDELAARSLVEKRVRAVLNAADSLSSRYPNRGPEALLAAGVPVVDGLGSAVCDLIRDGDRLEIRGEQVIRAGRVIASGRRLSPELIRASRAEAGSRLTEQLAGFLSNTVHYALREQGFFFAPLELPPLPISCAGRHALVVVRGQHYKEDLRAIAGYVAEFRPVLIAVDGAADAVLEQGLRPDAIVGDMDSVSDRALGCGAVLVVHAYPDGRAPGLARVRRLGLEAVCIPAPGTSEDLALLLADALGAELIVAVGTHSSFLDFLEKGRPGMASTFLVRLRIGARLVDARGVSLLYQRRLRPRYLWNLVLAALLPAAVAAAMSPEVRYLLLLWWMHLRVSVGM